MRLRRLCARCAIVLVAHHEHAAPRADKVVSQESVGRDALAALVVPLDACESRGKDDCLRAPPSCARVSIQLGSSRQRFVGICGSTSTFLLVCRTTCWRRTGQCTSRERRMAMLAGARSLHARPWERRYRHAFGGWFERGRLNLRAGEEPFLRDRREVT